MVSQLPPKQLRQRSPEHLPEPFPQHLGHRSARGTRRARRRSNAVVLTVLLLLTCALALAGLVAKLRDPAAAGAVAAPDLASEPVVSRERVLPGLVLPNAGFEAGTEGWRPVSAKVTRATPGRDGEGAARVAPGPTTDTDEEGPGIRAFAVIASSPSDMLVTVSVWVKGTEPGPPVLLKVVERENDRALGSTSATRRLGGSDWQQLTVTHRVRTRGAAIDVLVASPASTASFLVDAVTVRMERAPAPDPSAPDEATGDSTPLIANG